MKSLGIAMLFCFGVTWLFLGLGLDEIKDITEEKQDCAHVEIRYNVEVVSQQDGSTTSVAKLIYVGDRMQAYDSDGNWIGDFGQCYHHVRKPEGKLRIEVKDTVYSVRYDTIIKILLE